MDFLRDHRSIPFEEFLAEIFDERAPREHEIMINRKILGDLREILTFRRRHWEVIGFGPPLREVA